MRSGAAAMAPPYPTCPFDTYSKVGTHQWEVTSDGEGWSGYTATEEPPMSIVVTGSTGHLCRLVVEDLLDRGVPATEIVGTGRATDLLEDLAARGFVVRRVDFTDPTTLVGAF